VPHADLAVRAVQRADRDLREETVSVDAAAEIGLLPSAYCPLCGMRFVLDRRP
jgi:hypothetical protein